MGLTLLQQVMLANGPVRIDGITYFMQGGRVRKRKSKQGACKSRSEDQVESSNQFTEAHKIWKVFRRAIGELAVWKIAARELGFTKSDCCFHSVNGGCLRSGVGVWAFQAFAFSAGSLDKAVVTGAEREGWHVTIRWENGMDRPKAASTDQVYVGYFYDTLPRSPLLITASGVHRGDGQVALEIPQADLQEGTPLHLYLFFGNEKGDRFSTSVYVGV